MNEFCGTAILLLIKFFLQTTTTQATDFCEQPKVPCLTHE